MNLSSNRSTISDNMSIMSSQAASTAHYFENLPMDITMFMIIDRLDEQDVAALSMSSKGLYNSFHHLVRPVRLAWAAVDGCDRNAIFALVRLHGLESLREALALIVRRRVALRSAIINGRADILNLVCGLIPFSDITWSFILKDAIECYSQPLTAQMMATLPDSNIVAAFELLCDESVPDFVKFFLTMAPSQLHPILCSRGMHIAIEKSDLFLIDQLLDGGARVNEMYTITDPAPSRTRSLLQLLCYAGITGFHRGSVFSTLVDKLLTRGADPNTVVPDGTFRTPLHLLASSGLRFWKRFEVFDQSVDEEDQMHCFTTLVKSLVEYGADLDAQDSEGNTPLHYAVASGQTNMAIILSDAGASAFIEDYTHGQTASCAARPSSFGHQYTELEALAREYQTREMQRHEAGFSGGSGSDGEERSYQGEAVDGGEESDADDEIDDNEGAVPDAAEGTVSSDSTDIDDLSDDDSSAFF